MESTHFLTYQTQFSFMWRYFELARLFLMLCKAWKTLFCVQAMFFPSFFTGILMATIGPVVSINIGFVFLLGSVFLFLIGTQLWLFFVSLGFLGLGWNLSYVGATTLLTTTYNSVEKDKVINSAFCMTFSVLSAPLNQFCWSSLLCRLKALMMVWFLDWIRLLQQLQELFCSTWTIGTLSL